MTDIKIACEINLKWKPHLLYRQTSNIRHIFVGNKIADHSDEVGASPVGVAPPMSSFSI